MPQIRRTTLQLIAVSLVLCQPATSLAIEYLDVEFSQNLYSWVRGVDEYGNDLVIDQTSYSTLLPWRNERHHNEYTSAYKSNGYANSQSGASYQVNMYDAGVVLISQSAQANGHYIGLLPGGTLGYAESFAGVGDGAGTSIRIRFRVDEADGVVTFRSRDSEAYIASVSAPAANNYGSSIVFLERNGGWGGSDGTVVTEGEWTIVVQSRGVQVFSNNDLAGALKTFAASWTFDDVFVGATPDRPFVGPPIAQDSEDEDANIPVEVTGAFLTIPVEGGLGQTQNVFVAVPTQANNGPSKGALITGYKISSEYSPLTSIIVPTLPAGEAGLTIDFGSGPQSVVPGELVDFGSAGISSFVLDGFDPAVADPASDAFVMGLQFVEDGLASLTAIPTLFIPPGDFSLNGVVNAADYTVWRDSSGPSENYLLWKSHFGEPLISGSAAANNVPEPSTLLLGLITISLLTIRRR